MTLFWFIFPVVIFVFVLSWTDLQYHVGYAFSVSLEEGLYKFPLIWFQSFLIPISFLCSNKSKYHYESVSELERALRLVLSETEGPKVTLDEDSQKTKVIIAYGSKIAFTIYKDDSSVEINGYDRLIPPRLAFMMMKVLSDSKKEKTTNDKQKSLIG